MEGVEPTNIITDQDLAMKAAIALVFPHAKHRNCCWHIMQNAQKKIGHILDHDKALCDAFNDCLDNSWTEQEFDAKWDAMLTTYHLQDIEPNGGPVRNYGSRAFIVAANVLDRIYNCECCKFERDGILCCHVLKVMTFDFVGQVSDIPEHYILPRWTMVKEPELPPVTSIGEQMQLPPKSLKLISYEAE
ncbi:uncharacterized protein [Oryza sativa Japonica Group]|uniref:uncharacterized protein n=1 Tax=Oryza sativa subsp. japonica TaxID=39947 RepID=UPI00339C5983